MYHHLVRILTSVFAGALLVGSLLPARPALCADAEPEAPQAGVTYRLRAGDEVAISVLPRKEYDCGGVVLPDGILVLKNVGPVKAEGLTLSELGDQVKKVLELKLVKPKVLATLTRISPIPAKKAPTAATVAIFGAITRPGTLELLEPTRLRRALDLSGGTQKDADLAHIVVLHKDLTRNVIDLSTDASVVDPKRNVFLTDGDSVELRFLTRNDPEVKAAEAVRITGQVGSPGRVEWKPGLTLEDLILQVGKLTTKADVEHIQLQRGTEPVREINLIAQQELGLRGKVPVQPGDEFFVPEQKNVVIILGAVPDPGRKALGDSPTIRDFLIRGDKDLTSVLNPNMVELSAVQLIRQGEKPQTLHLDKVLRTASHKDNVKLQSGDVLFFPPRKQPKAAGGALGFLSQLGLLTTLLRF